MRTITGRDAGAAGDGTGWTLEVRFEVPQRTTAPGQSAVCYDAGTGERVLCGGVVAGTVD